MLLPAPFAAPGIPMVRMSPDVLPTVIPAEDELYSLIAAGVLVVWFRAVHAYSVLLFDVIMVMDHEDEELANWNGVYCCPDEGTVWTMLDDAVCTSGVLESVTVPDEMLIGPDVATTVIWTLPVDRETVSP